MEVRFSWQAQGTVRLRGVTEVTFRGMRSTLRALDVWTRKFVADTGNREVVSSGRSECRCDSWNRETAWQGYVMCVCVSHPVSKGF